MQTADESKIPVCHWDRERFADEIAHARTNIHPQHWPDDVRMVSMQGLALLGIDSKGRLYLDGEQVYTVKRWGAQERTIAWIVAAATIVTAIAACISAYADLRPVLGLPG